MGQKPSPRLKNKCTYFFHISQFENVNTNSSVTPVTEMNLKTLFQFGNKTLVFGRKYFFPYIGKKHLLQKQIFQFQLFHLKISVLSEGSIPHFIFSCNNRGIQPSLEKGQVLEAEERQSGAMRPHHS